MFREFSSLPKYPSAALFQPQLGWSLVKDLCAADGGSAALTQLHCSQWWSGASRDALGSVHSTASCHMEELTVGASFFMPTGLHAYPKRAIF